MSKKTKHISEISQAQDLQDCNFCYGSGKKNRFVGQQYKDGLRLVYAQGYNTYAMVFGGVVRMDCSHCHGTGKLKKVQIANSILTDKNDKQKSNKKTK